MKRSYEVAFMCSVGMIIFIIIGFGDANNHQSSISHQRSRRYLSFRNVTRFYLKLNFKANMVPWNQIFAQAIGFRVNWDDPPDTFHIYHHLYRRSVYKNMEILLTRDCSTILSELIKPYVIGFRNGLDGFHCVRRAICETARIVEPKGIYEKILKMIFRRQSSETDKWHNATNECPVSISTCPFSMLDVATYTDI